MLSMVNIFSADIEQLADFYRVLFDLAEMNEFRTPVFRGLRSGNCLLGFNDRRSYPVLGIPDGLDATGIRTFLTFEMRDRAAVDGMITQAVAAGATVLRPAFESSYGWYQVVLEDPQGNVFRGYCQTNAA